MSDGDVRLTASDRAVLRVLVAARGRQLPIAEIARGSHRSPSAVRKAVTDLEKAGLVSHQLVPKPPRQGGGSPRLVFWPTGDGFAFGAAAGGDQD